ncbi:MAG: hypothetical protein Rubg2KO_37980 [Rubricoccaceae bacterium]
MTLGRQLGDGRTYFAYLLVQTGLLLDMSDLPYERVRAIRNAMQALFEESATVINAIDSTPLPGSTVENELNNFVRPLSIKTAVSQSYFALESCGDYLSALLKSLSEPAESIAPWSLARSALEAGAISIWIGRPDIDAAERVNRSLAFRLCGLEEQRKIAESTPSITPPEAKTYQRLVSTAEAVGAVVKTHPSGRPTRVGAHWPGSTKLCGSELGEETTYRILSAFAHSQPFAIQQLSFKMLGTSASDPDMVDAEKHLSNLSVAFIAHQSVQAFIRAFAARLKLYGYLNGDTVKMLRRRTDEMQLPEERFRYCIWSG